MRGRRTARATVVVAVLAAVLAAGCEDQSAAPEREPAHEAVNAVGGVPPQLVGDLAVELGTATAVFGRGCRPQSPQQRCSPDGTKTYTLAGRLRPATVTGAWMQLEAEAGTWAVSVRFASADPRTTAAVAARAEQAGGLVVVLAAVSGAVLHAVEPERVGHGRITLRELRKPAADLVVEGYVTAATHH
jgi:hypothetical protein